MSCTRVSAGVLTLGLFVAACGDPEAASTPTGPGLTSTIEVTTTETPSFTTFPASTSTTAAPTTTSAAVIDPRLVFEPLDLPAPDCTEEGSCTMVLATNSGRLAAVRTGDPMITFLDDGTTLSIDADAATTAWPITFGPEDVLYLSLTDRVSGESGGMIAVATTGSRAGRTVASSNVPLDTSGDSTIVATAAGLVQVGCCGHGDTQPSVDETVVMGWVSASGGALPLLATDVWIEYGADDAATVVRSDDGVEQRWTFDGPIGGRDMPMLVATADGGVLLWQYDGMISADVPPVLYEGRPDGSTDRYDLPGFAYPSVLHPDRWVLLFTADAGYVRTQLP